ncbi:diadenylate cyclase CdaA [Anaeromyxobacter diazotrophicus]|uniref:Diadenylate cyclase n=1 Tax=Anaeromyxobacter diazotrophicus TaxID=2590199 RepID=A0A7I9VL80_9BACT|nr:diadenylate cyclase CdaA [Anaeromyxobacter diazotrophicus]GEJ57174.1 membrane protein [Anaeromyxobacter diazotrophicus]
MTALAVAVPGFVQYLLGPGSTWREVGLALADLAVVGFLVYRVLLLIRGTRAINVLVGLFLLGIGYLASQWANLVALNWVLGHFLSYSFIFGVIVLFQADIRRGLAHLGRGTFLVGLSVDERHAQVGVVDAVARAAVELARRRHGALIAVERIGDLSEIAETGVRIDAAASAELLLALFQPGGALHDGAVVLQRGRLAAARCLLPLTVSPKLRDVGTRHRAAVGLAEEVDAAVVVVSEERGEISLAVEGVLHRRLDEGALRQLLARLLVEPEPRGLAGLLARVARPPSQDPPEDRRAAV